MIDLTSDQLNLFLRELWQSREGVPLPLAVLCYDLRHGLRPTAFG